jgi:hypothetical protein
MVWSQRSIVFLLGYLLVASFSSVQAATTKQKTTLQNKHGHTAKASLKGEEFDSSDDEDVVAVEDVDQSEKGEDNSDSDKEDDEDDSDDDDNDETPHAPAGAALPQMAAFPLHKGKHRSSSASTTTLPAATEQVVEVRDDDSTEDIVDISDVSAPSTTVAPSKSMTALLKPTTTVAAVPAAAVVVVPSESPKKRKLPGPQGKIRKVHRKHHETTEQVVSSGNAPAKPVQPNAPVKPVQLRRQGAKKLQHKKMQHNKFVKKQSPSERRLGKNRARQAEIDKEIEWLNSASNNNDIESHASDVAQEAQSPALGKMLGGMWTEMRMFEIPEHAQSLQEEKKRLEAEEEELMDESGGSSSGFSTQQAPSIDANEMSWNYWAMDEQKQQQTLIYSLVYLVGGVLAGYLYSKVRLTKDVFQLPKQPGMRSASDFSFSIVKCHEVPVITFMGCCCGCLQWANTMDRTRLMSYWRAFLVFFVLTVLCGYT